MKRLILLVATTLFVACISLPRVDPDGGLFTSPDGRVLELHRAYDGGLRGYLMSGDHVVALAAVVIRDGVIQATATDEEGARRELRIDIRSNRELVLEEAQYLLSGVEKPADTTVRREIEAAYAKLADAVDTKNYEAFQALRIAGFATIPPDGRPSSASRMGERAKGMFERIQAPITTTNEILDLKVRGGDAIATVRQKFTRMQMIDGTQHTIHTEVTQREIWTGTPEGWKLRFVDEVRDHTSLVDGQPRK